MKQIKNKIFLNPGDVVFTNEPMKLWTVLGSCVSIIIYHPASRFTGMTHAQLPKYNLCNGKCHESCPIVCDNKNSDNSNRFVNCSLIHIISLFEEKNIPKNELKVMLFGGSSMMKFSGERIGNQNIIAAKKLLNYFDVPIAEENIAGEQGRTIEFDIESGSSNVRIQKRYVIKKKSSIKESA
jgi:chemotaxis protein CheD